MSFSHLGLSDKVIAAVAASGYKTPTPIQDQAIPHVLARRDVLGIAQTGTGKTAAFTLPMLTMLEQGRARARMPRTLILEPTRELAAQVEENFSRYGANSKLNVALIIGGVSFDDQDAKLMRGVDVLIATPGRLLDHFERGRLLLNGVELLVIDEADRMLDMGFIPDIERICKLVPFTRQTLFFTATMPTEIRRITEQFLHNPIRVEVAKPATTLATTTQFLAKSGREPHEKRDTLRRLVRGAEGMKNAIVFCNRKRDVAARGLDIPDVGHVYNFDVPIHADDYVHRIGRTGRAGRSGIAITLVAGSNDAKAVAAIEKLIGQPIPWMDKIPGEPGASLEEPRHAARPQHSSRGQSNGHRHRSSHRPAAARSDGAKPRSEETRPHREERPRSEDARPRRTPQPAR